MIGVRELRMTCSQMTRRSDGIYMGGALYPPETPRSVTTPARVRSIIDASGATG